MWSDFINFYHGKILYFEMLGLVALEITLLAILGVTS